MVAAARKIDYGAGYDPTNRPGAAKATPTLASQGQAEVGKAQEEEAEAMQRKAYKMLQIGIQNVADLASKRQAEEEARKMREAEERAAAAAAEAKRVEQEAAAAVQRKAYNDEYVADLAIKRQAEEEARKMREAEERAVAQKAAAVAAVALEKSAAADSNLGLDRESAEAVRGPSVARQRDASLTPRTWSTKTLARAPEPSNPDLFMDTATLASLHGREEHTAEKAVSAAMREEVQDSAQDEAELQARRLAAEATEVEARILNAREILNAQEARIANAREDEAEAEADEAFGGRSSESIPNAADDAELEARILTAKYAPEVEAKRAERESFYLGLGVPPEDARRLVARILAAYEPLQW